MSRSIFVFIWMFTLLLAACSVANSGLSTPVTNNGATTASSAASTGRPSPILPTTPGLEVPIPATQPQPLSPAAAAIAAIEANRTIPKLDRSDSLTGPDLDGNGVRDDVDAWIKSKLTDPKQIAAAMQSAKAMQKAILVDVTNKVAIKLVFQSMMSSVNCVSSRFPHDGSNLSSSAIGQKMESLMTNTKPRLKAYLTFSKALDGSVVSLPTGDTCD